MSATSSCFEAVFLSVAPPTFDFNRGPTPSDDDGTRREVNLDLVAKSDTESATVVVPADTAGPTHAVVLSDTNP